MFNFKDKSSNINMLNNYMLSRTLSMFNYIGLPSTLPDKEIEKQLQMKGYTFITKVDDELYALQGSLGGEKDVYGNPTQIIINNPALKFNKTLDIEKDGVLIQNDDMGLGLIQLYERYHTLLVENEVTMFLNTYNTRIQTLMSVGDDSTKESAELYLKKVVDGELGIIGENRLFDGIKAQTAQNATSNNTTQLIEFNQYVKASLFNEIGLNMNFNMKRERLTEDEVNMNDHLHTLIDNMLINRMKGIEKINEMFELNASVEYGSIWKVRNITVLDESEHVEEEDVKPLDEPIHDIIEEKELPVGEPIDEPIKEDDSEPIEEATDEPINEDDVETKVEAKVEAKIEESDEPKDEPTDEPINEDDEPTEEEIEEAYEENEEFDEKEEKEDELS